MDDKEIVDLYWQRSERAIPETEAKYGAYCRRIAGNLLASPEDAEECLNDTETLSGPPDPLALSGPAPPRGSGEAGRRRIQRRLGGAGGLPRRAGHAGGAPGTGGAGRDP